MNRYRHLGFNVYYFDAVPRITQLLLDGILPAVESLRADGIATNLFVDRFDVRGPHIFAILTVREVHLAEATHTLAQSINQFLATYPSKSILSVEALNERHESCKGKELCAIDFVPGFGPDNSCQFFLHPDDAYPFGLSTGNEKANEVWNLLDSVTGWALQIMSHDIERPASLQALHWLAMIDRELTRRAWATNYWRYHATTLLPSLPERLKGTEVAFIEALPSLIGKNNIERFDAIWSSPTLPILPQEEAIARVVEACTEHAKSGPKSWHLLREFNHIVLKQLCVPIRLQVPPVLYAWSRAHLASQREEALQRETAL